MYCIVQCNKCPLMEVLLYTLMPSGVIHCTLYSMHNNFQERLIHRELTCIFLFFFLVREKVAGVGTRDQLIVAGKSCYPPDMEKLINQENSNPPPSLKSNNRCGFVSKHYKQCCNAMLYTILRFVYECS